jgi:hypothetical protein
MFKLKEKPTAFQGDLLKIQVLAFLNFLNFLKTHKYD